VLSEGIDPWSDLEVVLGDRAAWLADFLAERTIQTNEVQRSWMLLPCFLEVARVTGADAFDLIELGSSAGLNLVWDRYRYRYANGDWGPAEAALELSGEERGPVPRRLLGLRSRVRRRIGIERDPIDVTNDEDALLLKAFVWADQHARLERLDRAIEALRRDPPELVRGDFVELLPDVLASTDGDGLTLVFQTASLGYGPPNARKLVTAMLDEAGRNRRLAYVSSGRPLDRSDHYYGLWVTLWPGGEARVVANAGFHGQWLEWVT
jgi:hypothetical protein